MSQQKIDETFSPEEIVWALDEMFEKLETIKDENIQARLEEFVTTTADFIESEKEVNHQLLKNINKHIDIFNQHCI